MSGVLQGFCTAGVAGVCRGAQRLCQRCPVFTHSVAGMGVCLSAANPPAAGVADIEDLGSKTTRRVPPKHTTRKQLRRVLAIDSTTVVPSPKSALPTVKLATSFGLETDGPPSSVMPHAPFKLKPTTSQRRCHSTVAVDDSTEEAAHMQPTHGKSDRARVSFASQMGKKMFAEALRDGYHENYFRLSEQYQTLRVSEDEDAHADSGIECLAMLLNTLHVDPMETDLVRSPVWKGVWRWFSSDMLSSASTCALSASKTHSSGLLSLSGFACLAQRALRSRADCSVTVIPKGDTDLSTFRIHVQYIASSTSSFLVPKFDKKKLLDDDAPCDAQQGVIFSPIAGYHAASDSVLVLDVDRHHTTPYWVPLTDLHDAVSEGYCVLKSDASDTDVPRFVKTLRSGVACDATLNRRVVSGIVRDLQRDSALLNQVVEGRLHQHLKSLGHLQDEPDGEPDEDCMLAVTAILLASPRDVMLQVLHEKHQAALWWLKRADVPALDASISKWAQQLSPSVVRRITPRYPVAVAA